VQTDLRSEGLLKGTTIMRTLGLSTFGSIAILLLSVGVASAQPAKAAKGGADSKVKVYDFSGDDIEGDLVKPEGTDLNARDFAKHSSLIEIRTTFLPEILKSAEDL
jgi:hypothetical protein